MDINNDEGLSSLLVHIIWIEILIIVVLLKSIIDFRESIIDLYNYVQPQ